MDWSAVLSSPAFVINLDKRPDRWDLSTKRIKEAGWTNIIRWRGVNGSDQEEMDGVWTKLDIEKKLDGFGNVGGKQGCYLAHVSLWKHIMELDLPVVTILEDDLFFQEGFTSLAPMYWNRTPRDFDVLFIGGQLDHPGLGTMITRQSLYCTHAYIVTREGVRLLYETIMSDPMNPFTIDCLIRDNMVEPAKAKYNWYAWDGTLYYSDYRDKYASRTMRNVGLVFQDGDMGTDIMEY
jgi:hypothetical protein